MQHYSQILNRLREDIGRAYGSLSAPHWGFVQTQHSLAPHAPLIVALKSLVPITDDTDLNSDVGAWLLLSEAPESSSQWCLCLSYVGPYCAFFRVSGAVLTPETPHLLPLEAAILQLLAVHGMQALPQILLEAMCPMVGLTNNPIPSQVLVFHLLFSDVARLPWQPSRPPNEA